MESSFKKSYQKIVNVDGSIKLTFKSSTVGARAFSGFFTAAVALFPVSCIVTSPVVIPFYDKAAIRESFPTGLTILWFACAFSLWFWGIYKYRFRMTSVVIKPGEGLIFNGKNLPFSDIKNISTFNENTSNSAMDTTYVYADTHGQKVKVTKYISDELADTLVKEIIQSSGVRVSRN